MGEKKKKSEAQQKEGAENKKSENGGGKNNVTVVLKADLHCEGCVSKVLKCIRSFDGVDTASIGEEQRITVVGKVDPVKLRERVEQKTHKKVELISPQPKKDNANKKNDDGKENADGNGGDGGGKQEKKKEGKEKKSNKDKSDEKKSKEKEPPVTTAVLKVHLHCEGCIQKIHKAVTKTKGYQEMNIDRQKELVTVTGAMDMKALAEVLKKHLKKEVEILPPKKEVEKKENGGGGGDKAKSSGGEKGKSGGDKGKSGGGDKGKNGGGGGGGGGEGGASDEMGGGGGGGGDKMEANRMQFQVGYPYPFMYGAGAGEQVQLYYNPYAYGPYHAPQLFSDENPNACSVM
ncbi:Heavy metal-associated isoprenylated plant protein 3 [Sesamum alatum]|uniref:Heavy metal-associated isoprenylated plant protein 3 n=1 Tax=Sesamum alatum TaxID=300844 RepID=A0AAE1Z3E6_9LAMI|nr:Heavy metal-associated isoprenylated plant protein 3 [Sesamum alatum]